MSLKEVLTERRNNSSQRIPKDKLDIMSQSTQQLKDSGISSKAANLGDTLPDFELPDINNKTVKLSDILASGPAVISFYRGGWCPYCNMELKALQDLLPEFKKAGAGLIAITPETPDNSLSTSEKNEISFDILSDIDNQYAKKLGLVFQLPEDLIEVYSSFNIDLEKHNQNKNAELPMPATYLVDRNGKILKAFVPEDYTERLEPQEILAALLKENG